MRALATKQPANHSYRRKRFEANHAPVPRVSNFPAFSTGATVLQRKPTCACGGGCPHCQDHAAIQPKLKIGEPNDKYEQEADRVAEQVMRMPDKKLSGLSIGDTKIQRKCAACASGQGLCPDCAKEEGAIQRKLLASTITPLIQRQIEEPEYRRNKKGGQ